MSKFGDGKTKESQEKWLTEMYGPNDWKDSKYMKEVWDVDDVYKHAREGAKQDIDNIRARCRMMTKFYQEDTKELEAYKSKIQNTPFEKLSKDDIKKIKRDAKNQIKWEKRDARWEERRKQRLQKRGISESENNEKNEEEKED